MARAKRSVTWAVGVRVTLRPTRTKERYLSPSSVMVRSGRPGSRRRVNDISGRPWPRLAALPRASAPSVGGAKASAARARTDDQCDARIERRQVVHGLISEYRNTPPAEPGRGRP